MKQFILQPYNRVRAGLIILSLAFLLNGLNGLRTQKEYWPLIRWAMFDDHRSVPETFDIRELDVTDPAGNIVTINSYDLYADDAMWIGVSESGGNRLIRDLMDEERPDRQSVAQALLVKRIEAVLGFVPRHVTVRLVHYDVIPDQPPFVSPSDELAPEVLISLDAEMLGVSHDE